jgi:hypothetical protein
LRQDSEERRDILEDRPCRGPVMLVFCQGKRPELKAAFRCL